MDSHVFIKQKELYDKSESIKENPRQNDRFQVIVVIVLARNLDCKKSRFGQQ